jgi:hypothetical protein
MPKVIRRIIAELADVLFSVLQLRGFFRTAYGSRCLRDNLLDTASAAAS